MRANDILKKRKDRLIAIVLGVKEREVDPLLLEMPGGERASRALRKVLLDQVNDFCDLAIDVVNSGEAETMEFNEAVWMSRIQGAISTGFRQLKESLEHEDQPSGPD